jgi:hypothetical protein
MLTEAWMDGNDFQKFLDDWNAKYTVILREMKLLKTR